MIDEALALGATLYLPATRTDLRACLTGDRIPGLRSAVIDLEDSVAAADLPAAMEQLAALLRALPAGGAAAFVRPRDPAMLSRIALLPGAERLAGFVLPKVTAETLPMWLGTQLAPGHRLMPTLETREVFSADAMHRLRDQLHVLGERVLAIRIGGNDLLNALGVRRGRHRTIYDGPLGPLIARLVGEFKPWGFALTAPVLERYDDPLLLRDEVARDLEHGLIGKTAIHPVQVPVIEAALAVASDELAQAQAVLAADAPAVFAMDGAMAEPATHRQWASGVLRRAALFGVADPLPLIRAG